jgi:predicted GNAT family N-acyltransferase
LTTIEVKKVVNSEDFESVFSIRKTVFVVEQKCPADIEFENEEISHHFLAFANGKPVGTCRWRKTENGYKCERFAVLKDYRSYGIGSELLKTLLNDLPDDATYIYLHAQLTAMGLYAKMGFEAEGNMFVEAGIQHFKMTLKK